MSSTRKPDLTEIRVRGEKVKADVSDAVTDITVSWSVGTVAELAVTVADPNRVLARRDLLTVGTTVTWAGSKWEIGTVDREYAGWGETGVARCRSSVAKRLRKMKATGAEKNRTPAAWLGPRVKKAGGTAVVQDAPAWPVIKQGKDETVLDALVSIASQAQMEWVEFDGVIYVGTPWWAYGGGPSLPTWPFEWGRQDNGTGYSGGDLFSLSTSASDDDLTQTGTAALTVPYTVGKNIRPWHRVRLSGTDTDDDGLWLVTDVDLSIDTSTPVSLRMQRPVKSAPVAGSSSTDSASGDAPVDYTDKAAVAVAYALAQVGEPYSYNAQPPDSWDCSKLTAAAWAAAGVRLTAYSYTQATECDRVDRNSIVPGDLLFYFEGGVHHVAMYIGNGQIVEAGSPSTGVHVTNAWSSWAETHFSYAGRPRY